MGRRGAPKGSWSGALDTRKGLHIACLALPCLTPCLTLPYLAYPSFPCLCCLTLPYLTLSQHWQHYIWQLLSCSCLCIIVSAHAHTHTRANTHTQILSLTHTYTHQRLHTHLLTHTHTHTKKHLHTHTYTHRRLHTHLHTPLSSEKELRRASRKAAGVEEALDEPPAPRPGRAALALAMSRSLLSLPPPAHAFRAARFGFFVGLLALRARPVFSGAPSMMLAHTYLKRTGAHATIHVPIHVHCICPPRDTPIHIPPPPPSTTTPPRKNHVGRTVMKARRLCCVLAQYRPNGAHPPPPRHFLGCRV